MGMMFIASRGHRMRDDIKIPKTLTRSFCSLARMAYLFNIDEGISADGNMYLR